MTLPRPDATSVLVLIVFVVAIFSVTPVGRATVIEAGFQFERLLGLGPWPIYHGSLIVGADGRGVERLMFWDGASDARSVLVAETTEWRGGGWSPDRGAMVVSSGSRIYLADRSGILTAISDMTGTLVMHVEWVGERIAALVRDGETDWLVYLDGRGAELSRTRLPDEARPARRPGLRGHRDFFEVYPFRKISPDGRWLIPGDVPCRSVAAYDLTADRRVEIVDGQATKASVLGWLRGSVLVWAVCDEVRGVLHIRAGAPDAQATDLGTVPLPEKVAVAPWLDPRPVVDQPHDRVLYATRNADEWVVFAFALDGHQTELARVPVKIHSPLGYVEPTGVSSDGRLLVFHAVDLANTGYAETLAPVGRIGVFDLSTGEIKWACDVEPPAETAQATGCAKARLR